MPKYKYYVRMESINRGITEADSKDAAEKYAIDAIFKEHMHYIADFKVEEITEEEEDES